MNALEFLDLYGTAPAGTSSKIANRWAREEEADRLLNEPIAGSIVFGDLLMGDGALDQVSPELRQAFQSLMGDEVRSYDEVRAILVDKIGAGDRSVLGMINKVKGQIGENIFVEEAQKAGFSARLADSGSQEAWDVAVDQADGSVRYVQVKMYGSADGVTRHLESVQAKVSEGLILDGNVVVESVDFAVPYNIFDEVRAKAVEIGYPGEVISIGSTGDDVMDVVKSGFDNVGPEAIEHLFGELAGGALIAGVFHMAVNGFLVYKGAKNAEAFWADTAEGTAISGTAIGVGLAIEAMLNKIAWIGGLPTYALVFATSVTTRGVLSRMARRGDYAAWIEERTEALRAQQTTLAAA